MNPYLWTGVVFVLLAGYTVLMWKAVNWLFARFIAEGEELSGAVSGVITSLVEKE